MACLSLHHLLFVVILFLYIYSSFSLIVCIVIKLNCISEDKKEQQQHRVSLGGWWGGGSVGYIPTIESNQLLIGYG